MRRFGLIAQRLDAEKGLRRHKNHENKNRRLKWLKMEIDNTTNNSIQNSCRNLSNYFKARRKIIYT